MVWGYQQFVVTHLCAQSKPYHFLQKGIKTLQRESTKFKQERHWNSDNATIDISCCKYSKEKQVILTIKYLEINLQKSGYSLWGYYAHFSSIVVCQEMYSPFALTSTCYCEKNMFWIPEILYVEITYDWLRSVGYSTISV